MLYKILIPKNFSFQECLWFLDRNYDDCLHEVRPNSVRKALFIQNEPTLIEITENDNHLTINVLIRERLV
jgi:DNA-3-methyladenine glycosylase II